MIWPIVAIAFLAFLAGLAAGMGLFIWLNGGWSDPYPEAYDQDEGQ